MRYCEAGYDMDGVLADGFDPVDEDFCVISGRHTDDWERTVSQVGCNRPIYLRPPTGFHADSGAWKAHMIELLGITRFYEDDPEQVDTIHRKCPNCTVFRVENGQIAETIKARRQRDAV